MTDQNKMPDAVHISLWKLSEDTALLSIQDESKTDAVKYHHDRVLQAACAERDALRALCEGMAADMNKAKRMIGGFTYDAQNPAQKEVSVNQAWHVLDDAVSQYEKHKAGE